MSTRLHFLSALLFLHAAAASSSGASSRAADEASAFVGASGRLATGKAAPGIVSAHVLPGGDVSDTDVLPLSPALTGGDVTDAISPPSLSLVIAHYDEPLTWLWSLPLPLLPAPWAPAAVWISEKTAAGARATSSALRAGGAGVALAAAAAVTVRAEPGLNWGCEAVSYLRYVAENYDSLPDVTVFVQGDPRPTTPRVARILRCLNARWFARAGAAAYAPLSHGFVRGRVVRPPPGDVYDGFAAAARARVAAALPGLAPGARELAVLAPLAGARISFSCCAQFAASRAALQSLPREWWAAVLATLLEHRVIPDTYVERDPPTGMLGAAYLEHVWARIFGRPLDEPAPMRLCPAAATRRGSAAVGDDAPVLAEDACPGSPCTGRGGDDDLPTIVRDEDGGRAPIPALPPRARRETEKRDSTMLHAQAGG